MTDILYRREMGDVPISIATSLALQGLFNTHPDKPVEKKLPASWGKVIYFNIRTLLRNIIGAIASDDVYIPNPRQYADTIKDEMVHIAEYLTTHDHKLLPYFYLPSYASLAKECGNADLRLPSTDKQKQRHALETAIFKLLDQDYKDLLPEQRPINFNDIWIVSKEPVRAFLVSHYPLDLLFTKGFDEVRLLESHTGEVLPQNKWYRKFQTERDERVPFNKAMLCFFGDSGMMFKPQHHTSRKRIIEIAHDKNWLFNTTKDRILLNLKLAGEGNLEQVVRKLF